MKGGCLKIKKLWERLLFKKSINSRKGYLTQKIQKLLLFLTKNSRVCCCLKKKNNKLLFRKFKKKTPCEKGACLKTRNPRKGCR